MGCMCVCMAAKYVDCGRREDDRADEVVCVDAVVWVYGREGDRADGGLC